MRAFGIFGIAAPLLKATGMQIGPSEDALGLEFTRIVNMAQARLNNAKGQFGDFEALKAQIQAFTTGPASKENSEYGEFLRAMTPYAPEAVRGWKLDFYLLADDDYSFSVSDGKTTFKSGPDGIIYFETGNSGVRTLKEAHRYLILGQRSWFSSLLQGPPPCCCGCVGYECCGECNGECTTQGAECPRSSCCFNCGDANCGWCYTVKGAVCCSCYNQKCSCCL